MTIQQYAQEGKLSENEVTRLRSEIVNCPRCNRQATQGEIEDLGECCHCEHLLQDANEALESYDCLEDLEK